MGIQCPFGSTSLAYPTGLTEPSLGEGAAPLSRLRLWNAKLHKVKKNPINQDEFNYYEFRKSPF